MYYLTFMYNNLLSNLKSLIKIIEIHYLSYGSYVWKKKQHSGSSIDWIRIIIMGTKYYKSKLNLRNNNSHFSWFPFSEKKEKNTFYLRKSRSYPKFNPIWTQRTKLQKKKKKIDFSKLRKHIFKYYFKKQMGEGNNNSK